MSTEPRELFPFSLFNRPRLGANHLIKDFRPQPVSVDDVEPVKTLAAQPPTPLVEPEADADPKSHSPVTGGATQSEGDSNVTVIPEQTPSESGVGAVPVSVEKVLSPDPPSEMPPPKSGEPKQNAEPTGPIRVPSLTLTSSIPTADSESEQR